MAHPVTGHEQRDGLLVVVDGERRLAATSGKADEGFLEAVGKERIRILVGDFVCEVHVPTVKSNGRTRSGHSWLDRSLDSFGVSKNLDSDATFKAKAEEVIRVLGIHLGELLGEGEGLDVAEGTSRFVPFRNGLLIGARERADFLTELCYRGAACFVSASFDGSRNRVDLFTLARGTLSTLIAR